jgi:hypothetical protein
MEIKRFQFTAFRVWETDRKREPADKSAGSHIIISFKISLFQAKMVTQTDGEGNIVLFVLFYIAPNSRILE